MVKIHGWRTSLSEHKNLHVWDEQRLSEDCDSSYVCDWQPWWRHHAPVSHAVSLSLEPAHQFTANLQSSMLLRHHII